MGLYRHVRDKDELLVLLLDRLASEVPQPRFPHQPLHRVIAAAEAMRAGLARHPWVVDVLAEGDLIAPSIFWLMDEIVAGFIACGLSHAEAAAAYRAVWQLVVGELIVSRGASRLQAQDRRPYVLEALGAVDADQFPTLGVLAGHWAAARAQPG
jgi:AcrR family transcriptional regulator